MVNARPVLLLRPMALAVSLSVVLAACSTPQERCMRDVSRELQTVNTLVEETELNLSRGYGFVTEVETVRVGVTGCIGRGFYRSGVNFCTTTEPRSVQRAVPIDPRAEERKLAALQERQADLRDLASRADSVCAARFPD